MVTKGGKLNVWCKETVCSWTCQCYHVCELLVYWQIVHVLESNTTGLPLMAHHSGLNHCQEDKVVVVFALDDTTSEPHPHGGFWILIDVIHSEVGVDRIRTHIF